ncbi:MAG: hypothetical protein J6K37_04425 [Lachnospiraceae bacterium]|nr:hypothetical protein [Lachnospiraceae bacterium]
MARTIIEEQLNQPEEYVNHIIQDFARRFQLQVFKENDEIFLEERGYGSGEGIRFKHIYRNGWLHIEVWTSGGYAREISISDPSNVKNSERFVKRIEELMNHLRATLTQEQEERFRITGDGVKKDNLDTLTWALPFDQGDKERSVYAICLDKPIEFVECAIRDFVQHYKMQKIERNGEIYYKEKDYLFNRGLCLKYRYTEGSFLLEAWIGPGKEKSLQTALMWEINKVYQKRLAELFVVLRQPLTETAIEYGCGECVTINGAGDAKAAGNALIIAIGAFLAGLLCNGYLGLGLAALAIQRVHGARGLGRDKTVKAVLIICILNVVMFAITIIRVYLYVYTDMIHTIM